MTIKFLFLIIFAIIVTTQSSLIFLVKNKILAKYLVKNERFRNYYKSTIKPFGKIIDQKITKIKSDFITVNCEYYNLDSNSEQYPQSL